MERSSQATTSNSKTAEHSSAEVVTKNYKIRPNAEFKVTRILGQTVKVLLPVGVLYAVPGECVINYNGKSIAILPANYFDEIFEEA